jgi:beta-lactamase regulating signal transducer with metallopeptidase domain/tetratricopeptide (TPR) repeat protein
MNTIIEFMNAWGARFAGFALPMLLQSAVLIALLFALDLALRKKVRATFRYAVWMLALVKLALPPSLALPTGVAYWLPAATVQRYSAPVPLLAVAPKEIVVKPIYSAGGAVEAVATPALTRPAVFFAVWLAVAVGMGIWVAWRLRVVVGVIRQSTEAPEAVRALLESCRRQLGVARTIPVRCAAIGSPAICGILRPVILIPPTLAENLGESEMRPVLLHELAHYKRGDLWVNHAQILLQIVYWYNPLLWLANAGIRRAREQAVDEMVLVEMGEEAQAYPATLLHVAKLGLGRPMAALGLMGILEPGRGLTQRILHIMNRPLPRTARIGARGLAAVLLLALVALPMACRLKAEPPTNEVKVSTPLKPVVTGTMSDWSSKQPEPRHLGKNLTAGEVAALEAKLVKDPEDFSARWDLLFNYYTKNRAARQKHVLWVIEHHPEFAAGGFAPFLAFDPNMDGSTYYTGKTLWLKQVQKNPKNAVILGNAAAYMLIHDDATAEDLLKKAQALEPQNKTYANQLGQLYKIEGMSEPGTGPKYAAKALAEFEKGQTPGTAPEFENLDDLAKTAFDAGAIEKARGYATELLRQAPAMKKDWNYGNAIQHGNIVLGRIALREGKIDEAKKYLLEAGKTPGSPQMNSFGPNMSLAEELLEKGETGVVLEYFKQCEKFWKMSRGRLDTWTALVKQGSKPDFGANLEY